MAMAGEIVATVNEKLGGATERTGRAAQDSASLILDYLREYPIPLVLLGAGIALLAFRPRGSGRSRKPRFDSMLHENPLAMGIAALAAGAIVGLTLPGTSLESEYLGEAKSRLLDQVNTASA